MEENCTIILLLLKIHQNVIKMGYWHFHYMFHCKILKITQFHPKNKNVCEFVTLPKWATLHRDTKSIFIVFAEWQKVSHSRTLYQQSFVLSCIFLTYRKMLVLKLIDCRMQGKHFCLISCYKLLTSHTRRSRYLSDFRCHID